MRISFPTIAPAVILLASIAGCDKPIAMGDSTTIVIGVTDSVWSALATDIDAALEPRVFTIRDERVFEVAPIDPMGTEWSDLRNIRQVLVIGEPNDPWIAAALDEVDGDIPAPPALLQANDVWARNQAVTIIVLPADADPTEARPLIDQAGEMLVQQYEALSRNRMYVSGTNTELADSLLAAEGFSLTAPNVYRFRSASPGVVIFRNDNPDPSQLIREVDVAWRASDEVDLSADAALDWRADLVEDVTSPVHVTDPEITSVRELTVDGKRAIEVQGVWTNPPGEWPAAGPFIVRLVECGTRTYLLHGWLYAPGDPKYQFMVQIGTLLDTFRCNG
jgi:hypothetical protein